MKKTITSSCCQQEFKKNLIYSLKSKQKYNQLELNWKYNYSLKNKDALKLNSYVISLMQTDSMAIPLSIKILHAIYIYKKYPLKFKLCFSSMNTLKLYSHNHCLNSN